MKPLWKRAGDCEGPLGLPMRDELAKALEAVLNGLQQECKDFLARQPGGIARRAKTPEQMTLQPGERSDISLITTDRCDLAKEALFPEGGDWTYFAKNGGRVTWAHQYSMLDVGRSLWMKRSAEGQPNGWLAKTHYHDRPGEDVLPKAEPWFPDVVNHYVQHLGLAGKSIGFVPTSARRPSGDDLKSHPAAEGAELVFPTWIGLEYAVAPIQCNPDTVTQMVSKAMAAGHKTPAEMLDAFGIIIPDAPAEISAGMLAAAGRAAQPPAAVERIVTRESIRRALALAVGEPGRMVRDAFDAARGRV